MPAISHCIHVPSFLHHTRVFPLGRAYLIVQGSSVHELFFCTYLVRHELESVNMLIIVVVVIIIIIIVITMMIIMMMIIIIMIIIIIVIMIIVIIISMIMMIIVITIFLAGSIPTVPWMLMLTCSPCRGCQASAALQDTEASLISVKCAFLTSHILQLNLGSA